MSVRRAQAEIDSREFVEWVAFDSIEPFGEERADLRTGILAAVIANAHRGKGSRPFKASEFMPRFGAPKRQGADEMQAKLYAFAMRNGAKEVS